MLIPLLTDYEKEHISERQPLPERYLGLSDEEMDRRIAAAKASARPAPGHPRPPLSARRSDQVRRLHRRLLQARRQVSKHPDADFIVFCGVHFMAESADVLSADHQQVILPDLAAGCSMADMADIRSARDVLERSRADAAAPAVVIPVTYINSAASIKAFCGEHGGVVCTSSNAAATLRWAWERGERILFLPDQHLGRNTAYKMGVPLDEMVVWDPNEIWGGLEPDAVKRARMILWKGHCSVHARFTVRQIENIRAQHPGRARHRPSRSAVGRRAGRRRLRIDRIHHQDGQGEPGRIDLGRRHRDPPRQPARAARWSPIAPSCRSISSAASARRCSACRRITCSGSSKGWSTARSTTASSSRTSQKHWTKVALDRMLSIP